MNNSLIVVICVFAVLNPSTTWALQRIKRSSTIHPSHTTIAKDFAVLNDAKKQSKPEMHKITEMKDKDSLYDKIFQSLNASKTNGVKHSLDLNKKRGINSPIAYILNNHERKLNEHHIDDDRTPIMIGEGSADLLVIDNNSISLMRENKPSERAELNESKLASDRKAKEAISFNNEVPHMLPLAKGSANVIGSHIVLPPQSIPLYSSSNPFAPIDQLMNMANMLMFKVGMDSMPPYRTQSTQMTFTPNMLMSLNVPNSQHLLLDDNHANSDYIFNTIEGPQSSDFHPPASVNHNGHQSRTVVYGPPLIFQHPIPVDKPKQLINIIESALGSVLANTDNDDDEIDLTCPIHHEKKSVVGDGKCLPDETTGDGKTGSVVQVCSCRLIKKSKNEVNKEEK